MANHFEARLIKIVNYLYQAQRHVTSEELGLEIGVSPRTIREDIRKNKRELEKQFIQIKSRARKGYAVVAEEEAIQKLNEPLNQVSSSLEHTQRIQKIMRTFIEAEDYIKLDDLADQLWISRSTMNRLFKEVREKFAEFELTIQSKPAYGLKLEGSEINKRLCYVQNHLNENEKRVQMIDIREEAPDFDRIQTIINEALAPFEFRLTDIGLKNLIVHLLFTIDRLKQNYTIGQAELAIDASEPENSIAKRIAEELQAAYHVQFPDNEIAYIQIHLQGKQLMITDEKSAFITPEIEQLTNQINRKIKQEMGYDFEKDLELFTLLSLHLVPMITRIQYGLNLPNPLIEEVKLEIPQGYECAVIAAGLIQETYKKEVPEGELGYLAMHYALAIERYASLYQKQQILIVCSSGMGTSRLLKNRIGKKFAIDPEAIHVVDRREAEEMDVAPYDYIFSTVHFENQLKKPIIYVANLFEDVSLPDESVAKEACIADFITKDSVFIHPEITDKEEALQVMIHSLNERTGLGKAFEESVYKREAIASTEVGNFVALPHPAIMLGDETAISIMLLKKPIQWKKQQIKFIFLVSYNKSSRSETEQVNDALIDRITDKAWLHELGRVTTYEALVELL